MKFRPGPCPCGCGIKMERTRRESYDGWRFEYRCTKCRYIFVGPLHLKQRAWEIKIVAEKCPFFKFLDCHINKNKPFVCSEENCPVKVKS